MRFEPPGLGPRVIATREDSDMSAAEPARPKIQYQPCETEWAHAPQGVP